jgi:hypothetical protein
LIPFFDIPIVFGGMGITPSSLVLRGVNFLELPTAVAQGDTKISIKIPLKIAFIENK